MKTIKLSCKKLSSLLNSMISNQNPLKYVTAMKLDLISTEYGSMSAVLTSSFKVNECGRWKLESEHHYRARFMSLPEMMGNTSCHPSFFNKPMITPKIYNSTSLSYGNSTKQHLCIQIDTGGLKSRPNSTTYAAPTLSTIR